MYVCVYMYSYPSQGGGLEKAFDVISDSRVAKQSAFCEKIILFLTDGKNSGDKDPEQVACLPPCRQLPLSMSLMCVYLASSCSWISHREWHGMAWHAFCCPCLRWL